MDMYSKTISITEPELLSWVEEQLRSSSEKLHSINFKRKKGMTTQNCSIQPFSREVHRAPDTQPQQLLFPCEHWYECNCNTWTPTTTLTTTSATIKNHCPNLAPSKSWYGTVVRHIRSQFSMLLPFFFDLCPKQANKQKSLHKLSTYVDKTITVLHPHNPSM